MGWEGSSLSHCRPPPAAAGLRRLMSQAPAPGPPPKVGFAQLALYRQPVRSKDNVCNRQSVGTLRAGGVSKGENGMNQEDGEMHASQLMQGLLRTERNAALPTPSSCHVQHFAKNLLSPAVPGLLAHGNHED
ncbi:uncharacterized protein LOC118518598 isoform X1 [Halichoerus grypus]